VEFVGTTAAQTGELLEGLRLGPAPNGLVHGCIEAFLQRQIFQYSVFGQKPSCGFCCGVITARTLVKDARQ
jgi:hypothetical protein